MTDFNKKENRDSMERDFKTTMDKLHLKARIVFHENPFHKGVWFWGFEGDTEPLHYLLSVVTRLLT